MTGKPGNPAVLGPEWLQISAIPEHLKVASGSVLLPVFASVQPNRYPGSSLVFSQLRRRVLLSVVSCKHFVLLLSLPALPGPNCFISLVLGVFEQQHGEYLKRR